MPAIFETSIADVNDCVTITDAHEIHNWAADTQKFAYSDTAEIVLKRPRIALRSSVAKYSATTPEAIGSYDRLFNLFLAGDRVIDLNWRRFRHDGSLLETNACAAGSLVAWVKER